MKKQEGITLVALIITVIILLILATVSISLVINSGIINKAKYSVDKYSEEENNEKTKLNDYEKVLNEYSNNEYVKDGLILHLDGIDNTTNGHNENTTTWYDLSGNNQNADLYNCTINDNNIGFNGTSSYGLLPNGSLGSWGSPTTIEILANVENKSVIIADNPNNSNRAIATSSYNNEITQSVVKGQNFKLEGRFNTSSINLYNNTVLYTLIWDGQEYSNTIAYANSILTEKTTKTDGYSNDDTTSVTIGRRFFYSAGGWFLKGKIYSIRVYNRELSQAEVEHNYNIDKQRFNLN